MSSGSKCPPPSLSFTSHVGSLHQQSCSDGHQRPHTPTTGCWDQSINQSTNQRVPTRADAARTEADAPPTHTPPSVKRGGGGVKDSKLRSLLKSHRSNLKNAEGLQRSARQLGGAGGVAAACCLHRSALTFTGCCFTLAGWVCLKVAHSDDYKHKV